MSEPGMGDSRRRVLGRFVAAALLVVLGSVTEARPQGGPPPAPVRVDAVRVERVQDHRMVTGELRAVRRSRVAAEEAGIVLSVDVEEGQAVQKGQLLAQLDARRMELQLAEAEAHEASANAGLQERRVELEWRQRDLGNYRASFERGGANPKEVTDAESAAGLAQARTLAAEAALASARAGAELLRKRLGDMRITAPFDGVIVAKLVESGEWSAEGAAVAEIVAIDPIDVWLDVPQQFARALMGRPASISVTIDATGQTIQSSMLRSLPLVHPTARTFSLVARLANTDGSLAPGMSVTAWVPAGESADRLTVAKDAVLRNESGAFVYVVRPGAPSQSSQPRQPPIAMAVNITVLYAMNDRLVIQSAGLSGGEQVVVEGNERLSPLFPMPVAPLPAQPPAEAASKPLGSRVSE